MNIYYKTNPFPMLQLHIGGLAVMEFENKDSFKQSESQNDLQTNSNDSENTPKKEWKDPMAKWYWENVVETELDFLQLQSHK